MLYNILYAIVRAALSVVYRINIQGRENIPEGATVVCANHTSNLDPVMVAFALGIKTNPAFLAKAELFKNRMFGGLLKAIGAIPVRRGQSDVTAIKNCMKALKNGKKLVIFPEGTRNKTGEELEAKVGAAMFAVKTDSNILPIYVSPKQKLFGRIDVFIGKPYKIEHNPGEKLEHEQFKLLAGDIMKHIDAARECK